MRRLATGLVCAGALGFLALFVGAAGCSAQGSTEEGPLPETDATPTEPGNKLPQKSTSSSTSSSSGNEPGDDDDDTGGPIGDGGVKEGGPAPKPDAAPPPPVGPNEGDPCTNLDQVLPVSCGFCGTKKTVCEQRDGSLKWSGYSACEGMPANAECEAGKVEQEACGNCGTRPRTCSNKCVWGTGSCTVPPSAVCAPATLDLTNAGCDPAVVGNFVYRVRSCRNDCSYNPYSSCISPPTELEVGATVNTVSSTVAVLNGELAKVASNTCPVTAAFGAGTAYAYTHVRNPLAKDATVFIYNSTAPGGVAFKTVLAAYSGDQAPMTADARKDCLKASTSTNASTTGGAGFAIIEGTKKVKIPAGGSIMVYTGASDVGVSGSVKVNVKTDSIAP